MSRSAASYSNEEKESMSQIKDRIKKLVRIRAGDLIANPKNWRKHPPEQIDAIKSVMNDIGIADALIARENEEGKLVLINGHMRQSLDPDQKYPVLILDVTEEEADTLLSTFDAIPQMAQIDRGKFNDLVAGIKNKSREIIELYQKIGGKAATEAPTELKQINVLPPPAMTWVLVGIPTTKFGSISQHVETIAAIPGVICETTSINNK